MKAGIAPALLRLGLRSLLQHKLRSSLSILGVVFGVGAVVAMSSVGEGARREALEQIGALGIDGITVSARKSAEKPAAPGLRLRDAEALASVVPELLAAAPVREAAMLAAADGRRAPAVVVGTTPDYLTAARLRLSAGRFLADLDISSANRVVVLGALLAQDLFPLGEWRGGTVELGGDYYQVIGVLESRATRRGPGGPIRSRDINRTALVPLPALDRGGDGRRDGVDEIALRLKDPRRVVGSAEVVRAVLHRTTGGDAYEVVVPQEILRQKERTQRIFNVVTGAVAAISLLVGGIGIMNIMLASVAERTREVGIRRAVGASRRDILTQFLVESCLLTGVGGVLGSGLGVLFSELIQRLAGWPTALSFGMLLLALLVAVLVGIGFGLYPAWRAAHLEPMVALRQA